MAVLRVRMPLLCLRALAVIAIVSADTISDWRARVERLEQENQELRARLHKSAASGSVSSTGLQATVQIATLNASGALANVPASITHFVVEIGCSEYAALCRLNRGHAIGRADGSDLEPLWQPQHDG
jgi:hypothetical protein